MQSEMNVGQGRKTTYFQVAVQIIRLLALFLLFEGQ